ncbi:MAG: Asp/Glu racemase [Roseobacter sp.]|jgi:maleate isomerase|nr:Asp/Glu racemase [Roseobacter sp.]
MSGVRFAYETIELDAPRFALVALQSDETIEGDMRRLLPPDVELMVSRVRSDPEVSSETLAEMENHLTQAAALFPHGVVFDAVGYGCTSGTAQIGVDKIAAKVRASVEAQAVTQPLSSLIAACRHLGLSRLALLSPYVASVSSRLQVALSEAGVDTPVFGSFEAATEATVVRIAPASITAAATALMQEAGTGAQALFISCTNLRTLDLISPLETALGKPVLTSNQVLAWHMMMTAGVTPPNGAPGRLFR